MATAKLITKPAPVIVEGVTLELSEAEAKTVLAILNKVGGSTTHSRNKLAQQVGSALRSAGLSLFPEKFDLYGSLGFTVPVTTSIKEGDRVRVVKADSGALAAEGLTGVLLHHESLTDHGLKTGPKVRIGQAVWGIGIGGEVSLA